MLCVSGGKMHHGCEIFIIIITIIAEKKCRLSLYEIHLAWSENLFPVFPSPSIPNFMMVTGSNELSVSHVQKSLHSLKPLIK